MIFLFHNGTQFCTLLRRELNCYNFLFFFYRTEKDWDNSLIIKRVLFEVFDCFLPLFYIAFYQLNVVALRRELVGLFWGKCVSEVIPLWDTLFFLGGGGGELGMSFDQKVDYLQLYFH